MAIAGLKRRGRTGDVGKDRCWRQLKTEFDTNGPEEKHRGIAPSGPDTSQPAGSKTNLETGNKKLLSHSQALKVLRSSDVIYRNVLVSS